MTGEAPWMGVTPQPPSESELRVVRVSVTVGADWDEDQLRAMVSDLLRSAKEQPGVDPRTQTVRIDLTVEVPWHG